MTSMNKLRSVAVSHQRNFLSWTVKNHKGANKKGWGGSSVGGRLAFQAVRAGGEHQHRPPQAQQCTLVLSALRKQAATQRMRSARETLPQKLKEMRRERDKGLFTWHYGHPRHQCCTIQANALSETAEDCGLLMQTYNPSYWQAKVGLTSPKSIYSSDLKTSQGNLVRLSQNTR